jgi:hypothetical protein
MPNYASQILPEDRWAVIHYVRALERAANPLPQDLAVAGLSPDTTAAGGAKAPAGSAGAGKTKAPVGGKP